LAVAIVAGRKGLPTLLVTLICLLYVGWELVRVGGDPARFVIYDGHYSYQMAFRFFDSADHIPESYPYRDEFPRAYRWQRILYPLTATIMALNKPALIPWMLILVNVLAIALGTYLTELILIHYGVSPWYAIAYGLYAGQLVALRSDMTEPMAQALIQLAILLWLRQRPTAMTAAFSLALLTKETALLFIGAFLIYYLIGRRGRRAILIGLSAVPYILLQFFLWQWLGEPGFTTGQPFARVPFGGWLEAAQISVPAFLLISLMIVPMVVVPTLAGLIIGASSLRKRQSNPYALSMLLHGLFILFLPTLTVREISAAVRVVQGLAVTILLYGAYVGSRRILNYSLLWVFSNVILLKGHT
jgi:hypothetical protein